MVFVENWPFFQLFFFGKNSTKKWIYDIVEQKNNFLGYKNKKLKRSKNWHFSKGDSPWFWSKLTIFPTFVLFGKIVQINGFYDILERKNNSMAIKTRS